MNEQEEEQLIANSENWFKKNQSKIIISGLVLLVGILALMQYATNDEVVQMCQAYCLDAKGTTNYQVHVGDATCSCLTEKALPPSVAINPNG